MYFRFFCRECCSYISHFVWLELLFGWHLFIYFIELFLGLDYSSAQMFSALKALLLKVLALIAYLGVILAMRM